MDGRNPAPTDIGFQPSKVVQDFFHPQYHCYPDMTFLVVVEDDSVVNTQFLVEPENACHWFWILGVWRGGGKHAPKLWRLDCAQFQCSLIQFSLLLEKHINHHVLYRQCCSQHIRYWAYLSFFFKRHMSGISIRNFTI